MRPGYVTLTWFLKLRGASSRLIAREGGVTRLGRLKKSTYFGRGVSMRWSPFGAPSNRETN